MAKAEAYLHDHESLEHRVLGMIHETPHGPWPRNTPQGLADFLSFDEYTSQATPVETVVHALETLVDAGYVERSDTGTYTVTDEGRAELGGIVYAQAIEDGLLTQNKDGTYSYTEAGEQELGPDLASPRRK